MPFIQRINGEDYTVGVWKVTEPTEELISGLNLSESEKTFFENIKSEERKNEWLAARQLLRQISGPQNCTIIYDKIGKPFLKCASQNISISHSRNMVAVISSPKRQVGIDIEKIENRIQKIAHKFINEEERKFLGENPSLEDIYLIWGIKESLYKLYGKGGLDFKKNLLVEKYELLKSGTANAFIFIQNSQKKFLMHYEFNEERTLVYVAD